MATRIKCPGCGADVDPVTGCAEFHEPPADFELIDADADAAVTDEGSEEIESEIPVAADTDPAEQSADVEPEAEPLPVQTPPRRKFGWKPKA